MKFVFLAVLGTLCLSPLNAVDFKCEFSYYEDANTRERFGYNCKLTEIIILTADPTKTNVIGDHKYRDLLNTILFTNDDVEIVDINVVSLLQIPKGLTVFSKFSNLIVNSKLEEIKRDGFNELKNLKKLSLSVDNIVDNTFDDLELLEELKLTKSGLQYISPTLFQKLVKLEVLNVNGASSKLKELPAELFRNNLNLREISFTENGLNCIRDGLLDGLNKLEKVVFDNYCIKDNYPEHPLSVIKDIIHAQCQTPCDSLIVIAPNPNPGPVVDPIKTGSEGIDEDFDNDFDNDNDFTSFAINTLSCNVRLRALQKQYNKLKAQKNCRRNEGDDFDNDSAIKIKPKQNLELIFKHSLNKK